MDWRDGRNSKYEKWYDGLIDKARNRELKKPYDRHHVHPLCLGGAKSSETVKLTYREHFLAHWLLIKFVNGRDKYRIADAFAWMVNGKSAQKYRTSWQYEIARTIFVENHSKFLTEWWNDLPEEEKEHRRGIVRKQLIRQRTDPLFKQRQAEGTSKAAKKLWQDPEYVKKITEAAIKANKERWLDQEFREIQTKRLGQLAKDAWRDPEVRARQIAIRQELAKTPEVQKRLQDRANALWQDPSFRELMSDPEFVARRSAATAESNRERVWTSDMTAKRVEKFKGFWDAKRGGPRPPPPGKAKGENHPHAKLNADIVREIRALEGKMKRPEVAKKFGLNIWHVRDIQKRKSWAHIE